MTKEEIITDLEDIRAGIGGQLSRIAQGYQIKEVQRIGVEYCRWFLVGLVDALTNDHPALWCRVAIHRLELAQRTESKEILKGHLEYAMESLERARRAYKA